MGSSSWHDDHYAHRTKTRGLAGTDAFDYDRSARSLPGGPKVHDKMDPKGVTRESRDSDAHPNSNAIMVWFDVTGSMQGVPKVMQAELPKLMGLLLRKNYIPDPQVLFGCVGDSHTDMVPLQVGQFESGIEMDDTFTQMFLEGGGGGTMEEGYELAVFFGARHTAIDCFEKRGKQGYMFLIGDETAYDVHRKVLEKVIGDVLQEDISFESIVEEAKKKYNIFFILPNMTSHFHSNDVREFWYKALGKQNVLLLEDPKAISELIATTIGLNEGAIDLAGAATDLTDVGSAGAIKGVTTALAPLASTTSLKASGSLPPTTTKKPGAIERL